MPFKSTTLSILVLLIVALGVQACGAPGRPRCGIFDRGYPLCGI